MAREAGFQYREVGAGLLGRKSGWGTLLLSIFLQSSAVSLPAIIPLLWRIPLPNSLQTPPPPPLRLEKAIWVVGPSAPRRPKNPPKTPDATPKRVPPILRIEDTRSAALLERRAKVTVQFVKDPEQHLERVLRLHKGKIGFGNGQLLRYIFEPRASGWAPIEDVPAEGIPIDDFYPLKIDERFGRYVFLEVFRHRDSSLSGLTAYALFDLNVQIGMEDEIRRQAGNRCAPEEELAATMKLQEPAGFKVQSIACVPPAQPPEK